MDQFDLSENIIAQLGIESMPEAERVKMLEQVTDIVIERLMLRLMDSLHDDEVTAANALIGKPEELVAFLSSKVADIGALLDEEIAAVKNELFAAVGEAEDEE